MILDTKGYEHDIEIRFELNRSKTIQGSGLVEVVTGAGVRRKRNRTACSKTWTIVMLKDAFNCWTGLLLFVTCIDLNG